MTRPHTDSGPAPTKADRSGPTRREVLRAMGLALIGAPLAVAGCGVSPGNGAEAEGAASGAPAGLDRLGVQLYTLRDAMAEDVEATLARVAGIGYREVEFAGYFGRTPRQIRAALDAEGLAAPSAHVGLEAFDDWPATLEAAAVMGHEWLVVASLPEAMRATLDDWRRTAERFDRAGEQARSAGIGVAFHNHAVEVRPLEGRIPLELFLEETDPALVGVQADIHWLVEGGADPVAFLDRWPGRVPSLHVKDRTADGRMADVGAGDIDWRAVLAAARRAGVAHYFVEHDRPADPFASVRASYDHLAALEVG